MSFKRGNFMRLIVAAALLCLACFGCDGGGGSTPDEPNEGPGWISFTDDSNPAENPVEIDIPVSNTKEMELHIRVFGMYRNDFMENGDTYQVLSIPTFWSGQTIDIGKPNLPAVVNKSIAVPAGATATFEILDTEYAEIEGYNIYPVQEPIPGPGPIPPFAKDDVFYQSNSFYPEDIVILGEESNMRGCSMIFFRVYPVQYNPAKKRIRVFSSVKINIAFNGGADYFIKDEDRSESFDAIFKRILLNSEAVFAQDSNIARAVDFPKATDVN